MGTSTRYTSTDLEGLPDIDGVRYEIIDGDLYVSKQPDWHHQYACGAIFAALWEWSRQARAGTALFAPGVIFAPDDDVAPDVVWISSQRGAALLGEAPHLHAAPDLVVEVLSPGTVNRRRDRDLKLKLYSRQGVREYWILDWGGRTVQVFRRHDATLQLALTIGGDDMLTSPLLPGFACRVSDLWPPV